MLDNLDLARKLAATLCTGRQDFEEVLSMAFLGLVRASMILEAG